MFRDGCVVLPRGALGLSAVCDLSIFLIILTYYFKFVYSFLSTHLLFSCMACYIDI